MGQTFNFNEKSVTSQQLLYKRHLPVGCVREAMYTKPHGMPLGGVGLLLPEAPISSIDPEGS